LVASLHALRSPAQAGQGGKPMIGFGDPVFDPRVTPGGEQKRSRSRGKALAYGDYWRGAGIDRNMLMHGLPPPPDTADELTAIAQTLEASNPAPVWGHAHVDCVHMWPNRHTIAPLTSTRRILVRQST
jgi:hypothetical protein